MENYQTSNILFLEFSHSEVSQLYLPINAIFPMLVAVYLQTPDKRLLKIQYFFNFKCRVPMFEDPEAPYSWDKIPGGWPDRGLPDFERFWEFTLREIFSGDGARRGTVSNCSRRGNYRLDVRKFKFASMVCQEYASEHNRRFKFDWLLMNTFTLYTRIPKNEFRQTIKTDNLNRLCSIPWVNSHTDELNFK